VRGRDLGDAGDHAEDAQAAELADRVAGLRASASGAGGAIRVTVGNSGAVIDLELDDRACEMTGGELADNILQVMRRAQGRLPDQVAEAVHATVGVESPTGRAVLDTYIRRFPTQPLEEQVSVDEPVMPSPPFPRFPQAASFPGRPVLRRPTYPAGPCLPHQPSGDDPRHPGR
jgi:hypothetical protein